LITERKKTTVAAARYGLLRKSCVDYSSEIASTGQTATHDPQLTHVAASIMRLSSFSLIQLTGHSPSQAPQLMQASEIL
jgi:hypothetical protein